MIKGVELEIIIVLMDNWSVDFNYGYFDVEIDDYQFNVIMNFGGNKLQWVLENIVNVVLNFMNEFFFGQLDVCLGYVWRDEVFFEVDNNFIDFELSEVVYGLLDVFINLFWDGWLMGLWGWNLIDERYWCLVLNLIGNF